MSEFCPNCGANIGFGTYIISCPLCGAKPLKYGCPLCGAKPFKYGDEEDLFDDEFDSEELIEGDEFDDEPEEKVSRPRQTRSRRSRTRTKKQKKRSTRKG